MLTRTATSARAQLVEHVTPYQDAFRSGAAQGYDLSTLSGLAQAQRQIELQAAMLGYNADFQMLAAGALLALPLLLLLRKPDR
jgi:DHA2 family multidrug resistance protein